ncbi:MAG: SPOR domain-containing protein [Ignavibacteriales bacterium]|nr:SPOR domain-containing protein [Ignavibacteriales bacterium]
MTISELQKKAAEVLGVSSSQKELAFDILISKISEVLVDNVTLKVPLIGFFQIKENDESNSLIFSPLSEDFSKESRTLYLTIESPKKFPLSQETDSGAFSIGVGKPLIPLTDTADTNSEPETSFAILKKSIEERVNEIISESDHLPYFNIWDDYYESLNNQADEKNEQVNLSELTADIEFKDDLIAENITDNLLNLETKEEASEKNLPEVSAELTPSDLLADYVPHKIDEVPSVPEIKLEEDVTNKTEFEQLEQIIEKLESLEEKITTESDLKKNVESSSPFDDRQLEEKFAEEELEKKLADELKEEKIPEDLGIEAEDEEEFLGLKKNKVKKIEWNWGDELKEEFDSAVNEEETILDVPQEEEEEIVSPEDIFKKTKPLSVTLFEQLDESIKKELVESEKDVQYLEYAGAPQSFDFVEDKAAEIPPAGYQEERRTNYQSSTKTDTFEEEYHSKEKYFNKTFLVIFIAFIVTTGLTIYLLLPNKGDSGKQNVTLSETDPAQHAEIASPAQTDTQTTGGDEFSDFPRVASLPVKNEGKKEKTKNIIPPSTKISTPSKTKPGNDLYKILQTDTRIYKTIYYDGSGYNVQVSSWLNKQKAENEVKRLRREGLTAFLVEANLPQKGGLWYRVRIGNFNSREEAEQFLINYNFEK